MVESGHAHYYVMYRVNFLYKLDLVIVEIRRVLKIASIVKAEAAYYFLMLLDACAEKGKKIEEAFSNLTTIFKAKELRELRLCIYQWRVPFWMRSSPFQWNRPMRIGLVLRLLCSSKNTSKGDGRLPGFNLPPPRKDNEYSQTDVCILCRFDSKTHGFRRMFDFGPLSISP